MAGSKIPACAAVPLLGAALVGDEELDALFEHVVGTMRSKKSKNEGDRLKTNADGLDDALGGGLERGRVVCVSCESGSGGMELCLGLLASSLLQQPTSSAAIIDTTGNTDIMRLYTLILHGLQSDHNLFGSLRTASEPDSQTVDDVAAKVLDRVKIMRVFDLIGIMEAVGEISDELEQCETPLPVPATATSGEEEAHREHDARAAPTRTAVQDSEDEDDDELLLDSEPAYMAASVAPSTSDVVPEPGISELKPSDQTATQDKVSFLLIDNAAQVINPVLKQDYIQSRALASTFLLSLSQLTRTHALHTLLLNSATYPPIPTEKSSYSNQTTPRLSPPPPPSIFSSNNGIPSLMAILTPYLDLHLLVSKMPRRRIDAKVAYGEGWHGSLVNSTRRGVQLVDIIEVLSDRWTGAVGAWGQL